MGGHIKILGPEQFDCLANEGIIEKNSAKYGAFRFRAVRKRTLDRLFTNGIRCGYESKTYLERQIKMGLFSDDVGFTSANGAECESLGQRPREVLIKSYSSAEGTTLETIQSVCRSFRAFVVLDTLPGALPQAFTFRAVGAAAVFGAEIDLPIR